MQATDFRTRLLQSLGEFSSYIEPESGHVLSDEMWSRTKEWFARHLRPGQG